MDYKYKYFKVEDFLLDESFLAWVKTKEDDASWAAFFVDYPKQKAVAEQAQKMILGAEGFVDAERKNRLKARLFDAIEEEEAAQLVVEKSTKLRRIYWSLAAAASVALLVTFGVFYSKNARYTEGGGNTYQAMIEKISVPLLEVVNEKDKPQLVILPDSSSILLQKGSRLSYPKSFAGLEKREVYLLGEAFFEVTKNPKQPFMVYANELVTKVLGTSFTVKAYSGDKDVVVIVKTGKVTVFSNKDNQKQEKQLEPSRNTEGVVLTPNQQIIFNKNDGQLLKSLVMTPTLQELPTIQNLSFDFDDAPVSKVFSLLEKAYGVDIVYDEELLKSCKLTASMTNEHLFEKLRLICLTIEAEYQVIDAQIVIVSKGCK